MQQRARDIMHKLVVTCSPETGLDEIATTMKEHDIGSIPVVAGPESAPVGIITDRDIVVATSAEGIAPQRVEAAACMTTPVVSARADAPLEECVRLMGDHQVRRLPLVNSKGTCVGIISLGDIARRGPAALAMKALRQVSEHAPPGK